jgi:transcriptional regulator with XRE-family HTH domain
MSPEEFKHLRESLSSPRDPQSHLTQLELANLLDINPMTISRFERGISEIPKTVAVIMLALKSGIIDISALDTTRYMPLDKVFPKSVQ